MCLPLSYLKVVLHFSVESAWLSVPMCSAVAAILAERVVDDCSYAVRSSAASEDRADVSAAGQNTTVLGCVGLDNVLTAVLRCWASLYSYQSVQYRRYVPSTKLK